MKKKINFISLGCVRNLSDSEALLARLVQFGFELSSRVETADFLICNTCGFLKSAREEGLMVLSDLFARKKKSAKVIAIGCMIPLHREILEREFPDIYCVDPSQTEDGLLSILLSGNRSAAMQNVAIDRVFATPPHYAYLKIADGCAKRCSYCLIPQIKGPLHSKPQDAVIEEFRALLKKGVKEIILVAQDLGDYGKDFNQKGALSDLLRRLLAIRGDYWLRLLYLYPDEITPELLSIIKADRRVCRYFDIPLQHVNNDILKAMGRKVERKQIEQIIKQIKTELPDAVLRTTFIVGFPGETDAQAAELLSFIGQGDFDHIGLFAYSREKGTKAAAMPGQISAATKRARLKKAELAAESAAEQKARSYLGRQIEAVVDGYHPESDLLLIARHQGQCPEVDSHIIINDISSIPEFGRRYLLEITDVVGFDLVAKVVNN